MTEFVKAWGEPGSPTVVMLPGGGGTRWLWTPHAELLATEYRVVALDLPAHGTHPDASFSFDRAIEDVGDVLDAEGNAVLVGHSLGGRVAMEAASTHENRVDGVLVAGVAPSGLLKRCLQLPLSYVLEGAAHSRRIRAWLDEQYGLEDERQLPPDAIETHDEVVATARGMRSEVFRDTVPALDAYDGPVMLTYGENEIEVATAETLAERVDAKVRWYEGGHGVPSRNPDVFTETVRRFLAEVETKNEQPGKMAESSSN